MTSFPDSKIFFARSSVVPWNQRTFFCSSPRGPLRPGHTGYSCGHSDGVGEGGWRIRARQIWVRLHLGDRRGGPPSFLCFFKTRCQVLDSGKAKSLRCTIVLFPPVRPVIHPLFERSKQQTIHHVLCCASWIVSVRLLLLLEGWPSGAVNGLAAPLTCNRLLRRRFHRTPFWI